MAYITPMQWADEGLVLGVRRHGETSAILELMTRGHGRHLGLVHGGRSRRMQPVLQPGNSVEAVWRARLDDQLGHFTVEPAVSRAARLISTPASLYALATLAAHLRLLPERDPHPGLYEAATALANQLDDPGLAPSLLVRFEVEVLAEFGFGLDLSRCAATGRRDDLVYVSPKSGRAVSAEAGEPYRDRLLSLPSFLTDRPSSNRPGVSELKAGFDLTAAFLAAHLYGPRGESLPNERALFVADALRADG
jgi:DNA repair protein RecO (recombination protein O)